MNLQDYRVNDSSLSQVQQLKMKIPSGKINVKYVWMLALTVFYWNVDIWSLVQNVGSRFPIVRFAGNTSLGLFMYSKRDMVLFLARLKRLNVSTQTEL